MLYDVVVVGGGMAGLTAAAFLAKENKKVLLIEKNDKTGGLVNSFEHKGFVFDGGIRSVENSGILFPMLEQLGLEVNLIPSIVTLGIEDRVITVDDIESVDEYEKLLNEKFPDNEADIRKIIVEIKKIMDYMDILYGIDNPLFKDIRNDKKYLFNTLIPWIFKYLTTIGKVNKLNEPVEEYLKDFTDNQVLNDIIAQHFFRRTPAFFALSYFSLYLDYNYPENGTGELAEKMCEYIKDYGGEVLVNTTVTEVSVQYKSVMTNHGKSICYKQLVWAADYKTLYNSINTEQIQEKKIRQAVFDRREYLKDKKGNDSVLTLYLTTDIDKTYFEKICSEHFFYTPLLKGLSNADIKELIVDDKYTDNKEVIIEWLRRYFDYTTYEISIPVLRNEKLAPDNQTGLIISTLFDYSLVKEISEKGWYDEFKKLAEDCIVNILNQTIYKGFSEKIIEGFVSTPMTMERYAGNTDGAITGWSFLNDSIPAVDRLTDVAKSVLTELPDVLVAGQWTYSPSGFPIAILTGKLAADEALKKIK